MRWDDYDYWQSPDWRAAEERLNDIHLSGKVLCPLKENMFNALDKIEHDNVKVMFIGQDPYPNPVLATGSAFSIPRDCSIPPSLKTLFNEYVADLHYPFPAHGNLDRWSAEGVLLWNVIPSCEAWRSMSHDWAEWQRLNQEILSRQSERGIIFVFFGTVAARYMEFVDETKADVIYLSHPSPRGVRFGRNPIPGSRLYSTINDKLRAQGLSTINWRL